MIPLSTLYGCQVCYELLVLFGRSRLSSCKGHSINREDLLDFILFYSNGVILTLFLFERPILFRLEFLNLSWARPATFKMLLARTATETWLSDLYRCHNKSDLSKYCLYPSCAILEVKAVFSFTELTRSWSCLLNSRTNTVWFSMLAIAHAGLLVARDEVNLVRSKPKGVSLLERCTWKL